LPEIQAQRRRQEAAGACIPVIKEEQTMANRRPSFLKRQKEQKRNERALEKRDARKARKQTKAASLNGNGSIQPEDLQQ
jgi:hypothetical protein